MTSEIRANKQTNRAGLGTVTYADTGIIVSGIVTCTELSGLTALNIAGVGTASTLDINGDIDVDGHTNLDNVSIAGVTTFAGAVTTGDHITLTGQNPRITFTDTNHNPDFEIYGSAGIFQVWDSTNAVGRLIVNSDGHIDIPGNLDCGADLDVDGHTNLDNVSVSGVSTFSGISQFANTINLTHASAGQNYIYFNEDLQFAKNGTGTRLKIDSSGDLAISTANRIYFGNSDVSFIKGEHGGSGYLALGANSEHIRILRNGKVGIGTNDPKQPVSITGRVSIDAKNDYYGVWVDGDTQGENHISVGRWYNTGGGLKSGYSQYGVNNLILENNHPTATHSLIIQPKGQQVAIGTHITDGLVHIGKLTAGTVSADADADELVLESSGNTGLSILSPGSGESSIYFGNPGTNGQKDAWIKYYHETHSTTANRRALTFRTSGGERLRIDGSGNISLGAQTNNSDIHSTYRCLQVYKSAYIWGYSSSSYPAVHITNNARPTTSSFISGWKRDLAGTHTAPVQLELYTGNFNVRTADNSTADSDITWDTRFTVTQAGKIGINKSTPDVAFHMANDTASPYIRNENTGSNSSYTGFSLKTPTLDFQIWNQGPNGSGYGGANSVNFYQSGTYGAFGFYHGNDARLRISSDGYVTKPAHPSFHARLINHKNATQNPLYFDDVLVNVGSHYKTSGSDQGKFVAPIAGTYFFFWEAIKNSTSSVTRLYLMKNGVKTYNNMHLRLQEEGLYANGCMNAIMTLAVGDKIHINLTVGGVHAAEYTHFGGYLVG